LAAVSVSADNDRVAVATIATVAGTWGYDGGGGGTSDEPDIVYEGTTSQSRKVSTTLIGRSYSGGTTRNSTATDRRHFLFKLNVTNYSALSTRTTPGTQLKIGSSSSAYYHYYPFGSDNYPLAGGWVFLPVSPNVSGYRTASGSPDLTAISYYSWLGDFTATSKSENLVIDAIDLGAGLALTGGDGGDTDGVFADFLAADEGTSTNRWGYIRSKLGLYFAIGELAIGENTSETAVATVFQDATAGVIVWENGMVETGYHRLKFNLGNASTDIDITGWGFRSLGKVANDADRGYTTTEDSRLVVQVTGTSGALDLDFCRFTNTASITFTSVVNVTNSNMQTALLVQSGSDISNTVIRTTSLTSIATLQDPTFGSSSGLHDVDFLQTGAGHAIEIDTAGSYDFNRLTFTGYGADTTDSAAIDVTETTGTVTINVIGGDTPTYKTAGATVAIVANPVTHQLTVRDESNSVISGARVLTWPTDNTGPIPYEESISITASGTTATVTHTGHGFSTNQYVWVQGAAESDYNGVFQVTVNDANEYEYTMGGSPSSPATGSPIGTGVILYGTTNGSGVISDTRTYSGDQDVQGRVRSASSPYYQPNNYTSTISSAAGSSVSLVLLDDE
jgi:hypothetical protein